MKLSTLGEFGLIERIARHAQAGSGVHIGIGDDCAVVEVPPGHRLLTTTDLLIEEIHFRRQWTSLESLGRKAVAVNVSDVAAMGGQPRYLYLGLGLPGDFSLEDFDRLISGILEAAALYGATLVGGDTCRSPGPLFLSVTAQGVAEESAVIDRGGSHEGDQIFVSGTLGDSALALRMLQEGRCPDAYLSARHHDPRARVELGRALAQAGLATAMIDLSDGLVADLGHLLDACGMGARVETAKLPLSSSFRKALEADAGVLDLALGGGEDYELLFTVAPEDAHRVIQLAKGLQIEVTAVGRISSDFKGLELLDAQGQVLEPRGGGFNHFHTQD